MPLIQAAISDVNTRHMMTLAGELQIGNTGSLATCNRFRDFGNIGDVKYNPTSDNKVMKFTRRALTRTAKAHNRSIEPKYEVMSNELSRLLRQLIFFTDPDHVWGAEGADNAQSAISATAGTPWDFDEGDDGQGVAIGDRTDILNASGAHVIGCTALVLAGVETVYGAGADSATLAEGVDYEHDSQLGQVRWLRAIDDDVITPTITCPAITSASANYMTKMKPNRVGYIERICRVNFFDQDEVANWAMAHNDFLARIIATDGPQANNDVDAEGKVEIHVLTDGYMLFREN